MITIAEIGRLKSILATELAALREPAERFLLHKKPEHLRYFYNAMDMVQIIYIERHESGFELDDAILAYQKLQCMAAFCLAQLTALRAAHPTLSQELPHGP